MNKNLIIYITMLLAMLHTTQLVKAQDDQPEGDWKALGPFNIQNLLPHQIATGRTSKIVFHPSDPSTIYAVSATGGLFISRDAGLHWAPGGTDVIDRANFATVCVDYTDDRIMYVGTGEPNQYVPSESVGIWKTTDGGKTWHPVNGDMGNKLVVEILMSPYDNKVLLAATSDGIWKTLDSGATWTRKKDGGQYTDMVFKPGPAGKSSVIYAAEKSRFYRSADMGETWTEIGLPGSGILNGGRIGVSKADSNVVYLSYVGDGEKGVKICTPVLKSTNSGISFTVVKPAGIPNLCGYAPDSRGQGNYNYTLTVDPTDANTLYAGGHLVWKSTDGGTTWVSMKTDKKIHSDYHHMIVSPYDSNKLFNANDGGIWVSTDKGQTWNSQSEGLLGLETYNMVQSPVRKDMLSVGAQDNGEWVYMNNKWYSNGGGDYNTKLAYGYTKRPYVYDLSGSRKLIPNGDRTGLNFPTTDLGDNYMNVNMIFSPLDTNLAFLSQKEVYRTNTLNGWVYWTQITSYNSKDKDFFVKDIALSPVNKNTLYVVTSDGKLHRTDSAQYTTPSYRDLDAPAETNNGACIEVIKSNPDVIYMSCGSTVYRSSDRGETWDDGYSPDGANIIEIIHDPNRQDESVYVATNLGVYYKNASSDWKNYSKGLPRMTYVTQMGMYSDGTSNSVLRVGTRGRGIFSASLYGNPTPFRDPENPSITQAGLSYSYYQGSWTRLPNFNSLSPVKKGTVNTFDITPRSRDDQFGFVFKGYVNIPSDGAYTFYLNSDEGSRLYIGDDLIVDNDGSHLATEANGVIGLKAGKHAITVYYFEATGSQSLIVSYSSETIGKQVIPASNLYRIPDPVTRKGTGSITREYWKNITATTVAAIPVNDAPTFTDRITDYCSINYFQDENFGERLRGYICPPYTGNYTFYIAGDEATELWLSSDSTPAKKTRIAYAGKTGQTDWDTYSTQKSIPVALTAGKKYYIEAIHLEINGEDYISVGWQLPSGVMERPIPASRIIPFTGDEVLPSVTLTSPLIDDMFVPGSSVLLNANASSPNGTISKVEFFRNGVKLGEDLSAPYSYSVSNLSLGTYTFYARATDNNNRTSDSYHVNTIIDTLRTPENSASRPGLDYKYYEGFFTRDTDYNYQTVKKSGTVAGIDISIKEIPDKYGIVFTGYINIPADGFYYFYTDSDDLSKFYIGNVLVIDNTYSIIEKRSRRMGMKAGKHLFRLEYANQGAEEHMLLSYEGGGLSKQLIPASAFFRASASDGIPLVKITSPEEKSGTVTGGSVTITASASDFDGSVSKVEFFANGTKLGEDAAAPYSYLWSNVPAGTYAITARATDNEGSYGISVADSFFVMDGRNPDHPASVLGGLNYKYYEGEWGVVPDFSRLSVIDSGAVNDLVLAPKQDDHFGYSFTGFVEVPVDGLYYFYLASDDGSKFYIGNQLLVNNDSLHGSDRERMGMRALKAGKHAIKLDYFEGGDQQVINLFYSGPGIPKQAVPANHFYRVGDNAAPSVSITAPASNSNVGVSSGIGITANATDANGSVERVEFYEGTNIIGTSFTAPYTMNWSSTVAGTYTIKAKAYDNQGTSTYSSPITLNVVSNALPVVSITSPSDNSVFPDPSNITLTASADDADGTVVYVEYYAGNSLLATLIHDPYTYNWSGVTAGTYSVTAKAYDNAGGSTISSPVTVIVSNSNLAPSVSITTPVSNATYTAPATISLASSASDIDGSVVYVEYYNGTALLATLLHAPYTYNWSGVAAGTYTITAKAYDNAGGSTTSAPVTVNVVAATCTFGTPMATALPSIPYTQYNKIYVLGQGGPNLSNVTSFVISWDLQNRLLNNFAMNTNNGNPTWYVDLKPVSTNSFASASPAVTISNSRITNLDGSYYAGIHNGNFVLAEKTGKFTIYFSNSATAPACSARLAAVSDASQGTNLTPNPAYNYAEIQSDMDLARAQIKIINELGSEVKIPYTVQGNSMLLDVSSIPAGIYTVFINEAERMAVKRMIVNK